MPFPHSAAGPFLWALTEKFTPKEKQALIAATDMPKAQADQWLKLEARAKKLEAALRSARIKKASQVYHLVSPAAPDEVLFLLYHSALKPVQERLRNYYQKYLPLIQEITAEEWAAVEGKPGTPRQHKAREEFIAHRLDHRPPRKPATEETPDPAGRQPPRVRQARQPPRWKQPPVSGRGNWPDEFGRVTNRLPAANPMPLVISVTEHLDKLWGGRPVRSLPPGRLFVCGKHLILRAKSGSRGTRADQGVCPTNLAVFPTLAKNEWHWLPTCPAAAKLLELAEGGRAADGRQERRVGRAVAGVPTVRNSC